jgi:hypothetical protein
MARRPVRRVQAVGLPERIKADSGRYVDGFVSVIIGRIRGICGVLLTKAHHLRHPGERPVADLDFGNGRPAKTLSALMARSRFLTDANRLESSGPPTSPRASRITCFDTLSK